MGYPNRLLSEGEHIEAEFRPHWSRLIKEGLLVLAGIVLALLIVTTDLPGWVAWVVLVAVLVLITRGVVRYVTTLHVITNERIIYRAGFIAKRGKEIPLEVINDVAFSQTIFERVFGTGDLLIESAGTHGQTRYSDIPDPEAVQSLMYRVRETRKMEMESGGTAGAGESVASQLERLGRLHDVGKLSDAEFDSEKQRLLGGD